MNDDIDRAIVLMLSTLTRTMKSEDAYKIAQSALALAHVKSVLDQVSSGKPRDPKKIA